MSRDEFFGSRFILFFVAGLVGLLLVFIISPVAGLVPFMFIWIFVLAFTGASLLSLSSRSASSVQLYFVSVCIVDGSVFVLGKNLSWNDAKVLRDDTVKLFNSSDSLLSVKCYNSNGVYGVRSFVKKNITHICWLEED